MYHSNMTHFLDDEGNISKKGPKEARELASFQALIVDAYTLLYTEDRQQVRCFKKKCQGIIDIGRSILKDEILWSCPECRTSGLIINWRGTVWENKGTPTIESPENEKRALVWIKKLNDELVFPIPVLPNGFIEKDFPNAFNWVITRITDYIEIYGMIVEVEDGKERHFIPICELSITDDLSMDYKLVEEYLDWWYAIYEEE